MIIIICDNNIHVITTSTLAKVMYYYNVKVCFRYISMTLMLHKIHVVPVANERSILL